MANDCWLVANWLVAKDWLLVAKWLAAGGQLLVPNGWWPVANGWWPVASDHLPRFWLVSKRISLIWIQPELLELAQLIFIKKIIGF